MKNKILSGGGKNLPGGGQLGWRGRKVGEEGEESEVKGGRKWGLVTPLSTPLISKIAESFSKQILSSRGNHKLYRRSYMSAHDLLILF